MPITADMVGVSGEPVDRSWTSDQALLYAVAVGAGLGSPSSELAFTTENSTDTPQQVLPSFVCLTTGGSLPIYDQIDFTKMLHAEQGFTLHRPLSPAGTLRSVSTLTAVLDKGSGKLVTTRTEVTDPEDDSPVATVTSGMFFRGEGGFGGERGPSDDWILPDREPDHTVVYETRPEQALLYRLTGDRNRLHSDPRFAERSGFDRPILHGMATYGFTARALLHAVANSDPAKFVGMSARFSKSVWPGDTLTIQIWQDGSDVMFRTMNQAGDAVLDRGRASVR
jgi:acyl dehydratase